MTDVELERLASEVSEKTLGQVLKKLKEDKYLAQSRWTKIKDFTIRSNGVLTP